MNMLEEINKSGVIKIIGKKLIVWDFSTYLIIDEGFSNLDKSNINNLINWLLEQDVTLLLVLHNLDKHLIEKFDFCLKF
ncbi:hypothetical protein [Mesomycoplasma ovipneumoniae]|uniref:hypothetical protein n=1 Tax=Mesomycoplasma ovipneumoniae TaxID=29562 RepID=UPI0024AD35A5|nr:hypothetical protein [Mesomycoplasma ovipneumoniae]WHF53312.1 hypothetical protein QJQ40_02590 [Mesomycoplasma ovipneumoniae]